MTAVAERRPERIVETAPAKINLALHVTGRRDDGYHLLDSLVTFAEDGDELAFERPTATVSGSSDASARGFRATTIWF